MSHSCGHDGREHSEREALEGRMRTSLSRIRHKLLVMSGKGGVGKSTVAVNIAVWLSKKGYRTGLMDVDLHGPSIPHMTGLAGLPPESDDNRIIPLTFNDRLSVLSIGSLLRHPDDAVIWRGPLKIGAIRQFIGDAEWGDLDVLVIDSPPGTGDEPLTVAQDIPGVQALVVTTPQEVSLADVRKSINFCRKVGMPVLGVIENMSGYACPKCGQVTNIFGSGGGEKMAMLMDVPFLGRIPIDPRVVESGERGKPIVEGYEDAPAAVAYGQIAGLISEFIQKQPEPRREPGHEATSPAAAPSNGTMRIAVPTAEGVLCAHFGHCEKFALMTVEEGRIVKTEWLTPPPHEPGVIPKWMAGQGATAIIAGGMGSRAQGLFREYGIQVITGASAEAPEKVVTDYLKGVLVTGENSCDH